MSTTTINDRLAGAERGIRLMRVIAQSDGADLVPAIQRHLDALEREEASVQSAVLAAPDEVEQRLGLLLTRLEIAWASLTADVSDDWATFAAAVEDEILAWETYLERLQVRTAERTSRARAEAEAALRDVRTRLIEVDERLARARAVGVASHEERRRVTADRHALEEQANELSTKLT